jgi:hypothetical protein
MDTNCVFCDVRTEFLYNLDGRLSYKGFSVHYFANNKFT